MDGGMNAKLSCSFLLPFVFHSITERAALFFFSRAELLSTSSFVRPGTDCFPLVFLVSDGRTSQYFFLLRLRRAHSCCCRGSSHRNNNRPAVRNGVSPSIPYTRRPYGTTATTDRHRSCRGASFAPLRLFFLRGKPVRYRVLASFFNSGTGGERERKQHQHRSFLFLSLVFCLGR